MSWQFSTCKSDPGNTSEKGAELVKREHKNSKLNFLILKSQGQAVTVQHLHTKSPLPCFGAGWQNSKSSALSNLAQWDIPRRAVWVKGLPSLRAITQGRVLLLSCSWRELLLEETLSTPSSICNRKEAAKSIKHFPSLKAINQSARSGSPNSACIQHTTAEKSCVIP